jgi:hypothetical protein
MKKIVFFCFLGAPFFLIFGCQALDLGGRIMAERSLIQTFKAVQLDVDECVRQSSEAGKGPYKPCPVDPHKGWYYEMRKLENPNDYVRYLLQEYKFEPDQRDFVQHCLFQKGYFKPEKPPHSY